MFEYVVDTLKKEVRRQIVTQANIEDLQQLEQ
jgi:hypothetical protein